MNRMLLLFLVLSILVCSFGPVANAMEWMDVANHLSDVEFFGQYDGFEWTVEGKLNYSYSDELKEIGEMVKEVENDDYSKVKKAYFDYCKDVKEWENKPGATNSKVAGLFAEGISQGSGVTFANEVTFGKSDDWQLAEVDLTGFITEGKNIFQLMAKGRYGGDIIVSGIQNDPELMPQLHIVVDGIGRVYTPYKDGYASYLDINKEFLEPLLRVRESGVPIDYASKRTFICFELNDISSTSTITAASLSFYVKSEAIKEEQSILLYKDGSDDRALNWSTKIKNLYSWADLSADELNWNNPPFADAEFQYGRDRLQQIPNLSYLYARTGDEYYAYNAIRIMLHFYYKYGNTVGSGYSVPGGYPRSLDTGVRTGSVATAFPYLMHSIHMDEERFVDLAKSMWIAGNYLQVTKSSFNWGIIEMSGLLTLTEQFPEFTDSEKWQAYYIQRARDLCFGNALEDGTYVEDASGYTITSLSSYNNLRLPYDNADAIGQDYDDMLKDMAEYCMNYTTPSGADPMWGDSSAANNKTDTGAIAVAQQILDDQNLLYWLTEGKQGEKPSYTSRVYPAKRMVIQRTGWLKDDYYLMTEATAAAGSHAHYDDMAVIVAAYGKTLLTDQGRFMYDGGNDLSQWINSAEAHNTVDIVNDAPKTKGSENRIAYFVTNNGFDFSHAVENINSVEFNRYIFFVRPCYWIVSDILTPNEPDLMTTYNQTWHSSVNFTMNDDTKAGKTTFSDGKNIQVVPLNPERLTTSMPKGYFASAYGNARDINYISYKQTSSGTVKFDTVLYPNSSNDNTEVGTANIPLMEDVNGTAMKIMLDDGKMSSEDYYYLSYGPSDSMKEVEFDRYCSDGKAVLVQNNSQGDVTSAHIVNASFLKRDDMPLIKCDVAIGDIKVEWSTVSIEIETSENIEQSDFPIKIYAPNKLYWVKLNGKDLPPESIRIEDGYLWIGGAQ